jgi:hypothetical protein
VKFDRDVREALSGKYSEDAKAAAAGAPAAPPPPAV